MDEKLQEIQNKTYGHVISEKLLMNRKYSNIPYRINTNFNNKNIAMVLDIKTYLNKTDNKLRTQKEPKRINMAYEFDYDGTACGKLLIWKMKTGLFFIPT